MIIKKSRVCITELMEVETQEPYQSSRLIGGSVVQHIQRQAHRWHRRDERNKRIRENKPFTQDDGVRRHKVSPHFTEVNQEGMS